ncbi:MAG: nuclear transport factor 2 family protein [Bacteroidota bacterium]
MKKITNTACILFLSIISFAQIKEAGSSEASIKQFMFNKDTMRLLKNNNEQEIKDLLKQYNNAIEKLNVSGTEKLFTTDSKIFESGGSEGNYAHYIEHHLIPELKEFKSFLFSNYKVEVEVDGKYAFATETYNYTIVEGKDNAEVKLKGVTTSVLKKVKGKWKIMISHNSARK